jgi:hypothetical protein
MMQGIHYHVKTYRQQGIALPDSSEMLKLISSDCVNNNSGAGSREQQANKIGPTRKKTLIVYKLQEKQPRDHTESPGYVRFQ